MVMGKGLIPVVPGQQRAAIGVLFTSIYLWDVVCLITKTKLDGIGGKTQTAMKLNMYVYKSSAVPALLCQPLPSLKFTMSLLYKLYFIPK